MKVYHGNTEVTETSYAILGTLIGTNRTLISAPRKPMSVRLAKISVPCNRTQKREAKPC